MSSLFAALLNGAAICPLNLQPDHLINFGKWLNGQGITIYHSVPSVFRQWAERDDVLPKLRLIRLEGDQTLATEVEIYKERFTAGGILVNGLGATECGIVRQYFTNQKSDIQTLVPIGYEVDGMSISVLDEAGQLVPANTVGEIVVKSQYLAQGYWQDQARTKEAFSCVGGEGGERTYRTGDLGRMHMDGCLTYTGRKYAEVMISGTSVDIAHVETVLRELEAVKEAVVVAEENRSVVRLIAYLVPSTHPGAAPSVLKPIATLMEVHSFDGLIIKMLTTPRISEQIIRYSRSEPFSLNQ